MVNRDELLGTLSVGVLELEIRSPVVGTLTAICVPVNETVAIGATLAIITRVPVVQTGVVRPSEIRMPALGESVESGMVVRWLKVVGETVEEDEPLLEVSTDKVDTQIPSPVAGVLEEIMVEEGETVDVGGILAVIAVPDYEADQRGRRARVHDPPSRPSGVPEIEPVQRVVHGQTSILPALKSVLAITGCVGHSARGAAYRSRCTAHSGPDCAVRAFGGHAAGAGSSA